jgi:hypothetical protein
LGLPRPSAATFVRDHGKTLEEWIRLASLMSLMAIREKLTVCLAAER